MGRYTFILYYFSTCMRACILFIQETIPLSNGKSFASSHCFNKLSATLSWFYLCTSASKALTKVPCIALKTRLPVVGDCEGDCCGEPTKGDSGS